jgi:hypothetical protein
VYYSARRTLGQYVCRVRRRPGEGTHRSRPWNPKPARPRLASQVSAFTPALYSIQHSTTHSLRKLAESYQAIQAAQAAGRVPGGAGGAPPADDDDEVPDLIENFDAVAVEGEKEGEKEGEAEAEAEEKPTTKANDID